MAAAARSRFGPWFHRLVRPRSWPVRWRLAAASAGLTLAILLVFGGAIGQIATQRIRDDFNNEVRSAVQILANEFEVVYPALGEPQALKGPQLNEFVLPNDASAKIFDVNGNVLKESTNAMPLGRPASDRRWRQLRSSYRCSAGKLRGASKVPHPALHECSDH